MTLRDRAAGLIRAALADGPRVAGDVTAETGLNVRTVRRAADDLGVIRTRDGGRIWWALPASQTAGTGHGGTAPVPATPDPHSGTQGAEHPPVLDERTPHMTDQIATSPAGPRYLMCSTTGLTWPGSGRVLVRGDVVQVPEHDTAEWRATVDRYGASFLDDLSPAAQAKRWGVVHLVEVDGPPSVPVPAAPGDRAPRRSPIVPDALPSGPGASPSRRVEIEGTRPMVAGLGGTGPVEIVADRWAEVDRA